MPLIVKMLLAQSSPTFSDPRCLFHGLSQNSKSYKLIKLDLPIDSLLNIPKEFFSKYPYTRLLCWIYFDYPCFFAGFLPELLPFDVLMTSFFKRALSSSYLTNGLLSISINEFDSPFFFMILIKFLISFLVIFGISSFFRVSNPSTNLISS
jgi:hypothetical protein